MAEPVLVVETTTVVLLLDVLVDGAGIGSKVTWAVYAGPPGGQPPLDVLLPADLVEL